MLADILLLILIIVFIRSGRKRGILSALVRLVLQLVLLAVVGGLLVKNGILTDAALDGIAATVINRGAAALLALWTNIRSALQGEEKLLSLYYAKFI